MTIGQSKLRITNDDYFKKIIKYHGFTIYNDNSNDRQFSLVGPYREYNHLVNLNNIFSTCPRCDIIDRTSSIKMPFNFFNPSPWIPISFEKIISLEDCFSNRVNYYNKKDKPINLFWSGGIDSTAVVSAFLRYSDSYKHLRIYYTVWSIKENPGFYLMLKKIPDLKMVDYAGDEYFLDLDGINITGDVADEITASLDKSFFDFHGYDGLKSTWENGFHKWGKELSYDGTPLNPDLIDFCRDWFKFSGIEIKTLLEARWWFYISTKYYAYSNLTIMTGEDIECFYSTREFELYWGQNIDSLISKKGYQTYKQTIKDFIEDYNKDYTYRKEKIKLSSSHLDLFRNKKNILQDKRFIAILEDGTRIATDNLPLLNEKEYRDKYGDSLNYLFNETSKS